MSSASDEDEATQQSKDDLNDLSNSEKTIKGGKPKGPEHEHFTFVEMVNGRPKLKCKYCSQDIMRHAERMRSHLLTKCPNTPSEVRKKFEGTVKPRTDGKNPRSVSETNASGNNGPSNKRAKLDLNISDLTCSSDDEDECEESSSAMKLLSTLFKGVTRNADGPSSSRKSMKQMSDAEVERELKEMQVKKMRTQVRMMEEQMQLYNSLGYKLGKLLRTMDDFFKAKTNEPKEFKFVDLTQVTTATATNHTVTGPP